MDILHGKMSVWACTPQNGRGAFVTRCWLIMRLSVYISSLPRDLSRIAP